MIGGMLFGMFAAGGGPHHIKDFHGDRFHKTVQTDHGHGQIGGEQQQVMHGGHAHVGTGTGGGDGDKGNQEP